MKPINYKHMGKFFTDHLGNHKETNHFGETMEQMVARVESEYMPATKAQKKKIYKNLLQFRDSKANKDPDSIKLINKLIGDRRFINKACVIVDGSHALFRIWTHYSSYQKTLYVVLDQDVFDPEKYSLNYILNYFLNHYETIPFQVHSLIDAVRAEVEFQEFADELDDMDYYDWRDD